jgi:hypothetical protein
MNETLLTIFQVAGQKDYEFSYKTGTLPENVFTLDKDNKKLFVFIGNPEAEDLDTILKDLLVNLQK